MPVARTLIARLRRPTYLKADVIQFIADYRAYDLNARAKVKPVIQLLATDDDDERFWKLRDLRRAAVPITI